MYLQLIVFLIILLKVHYFFSIFVHLVVLHIFQLLFLPLQTLIIKQAFQNGETDIRLGKKQED